MDDYPPFARLIEAVRPWLGQLVIVGGWAHRLYWAHPVAARPSYSPLQTRDADLAFSTRERIVGDIGSALEAAHFAEKLSTDHTPPVSRYVLGDDDQGFYAEFLVPLHGSGTTRKGAPDATLARGGVTAQKLRYLDVLLTDPWTVQLTPAVHPVFSEPAEVRIANPAAFIVQKLLIHKDRLPRKQAQDALYIHDTLELFSARLDRLNALWATSVRPNLPTATANRVRRLAREQFGTVSDTIRNAVTIPADRTLRPDRFQALCSLGISELLGVPV